MAIQFLNLVDVSETRTGATATDAYTLTVSTRQTSGATPNPGTGGLKVQYNDGTNNHGFGLVAGSTSSDFLTSGPMHFYTNSDLDTKNATGYAMMIGTNQNVVIGSTQSTSSRLFVDSGSSTALSLKSSSPKIELINTTTTTQSLTTILATAGGGGTSPPKGQIQWRGPSSSNNQGLYLQTYNTSSPYTTAEIYLPVANNNGNFHIKLNNLNALEINPSTQDVGINQYIYHLGDDNTKFGFVANDNFGITTNGTERVRVTSGGSVGIGTNNPGAKLDVEGNAVIGSTLNTATGQWAVAIGNDNTSSGLDSLATGETTTASGRQSFSGGFNTTASGNASFAVGGGTTASGENAFAACGTTVASGISSAAFGAFSEATATNSFAINGDTTASGESSFSAGVSTNARGLASIATGQSCGTSVSANGAFAGGTVSNANAQFSIAYGDVANASGRVSQALGYIVNATGQYSFAQGFNNTVNGTASAVFGQQNTSHGTAAWSLSTGFLNQTRDSASLTVGSFNGMTASSASREQFMLGRYLNVPRNSSGTPSQGCLVVGEHNAYLNRPNVKFAVGTGVGVGAEADSFTVLKDGNVLMEQVVNKNYSSDSAAASGGVPVGGIYHNSGDLKIRLT
jgi:hypothetical protein